ncbi:MAG: putative dehydrogenase [Actinomycetia bacterium]|nr:putative dehydrogenase [Actinomycetes bacterium]
MGTLDGKVAFIGSRGASGLAAMRNAMPVQILQPSDISYAIAFLVSDQAKWITGVSPPVDAGFSVR